MAPGRLPPLLLLLVVAGCAWRPVRGQEEPPTPDWRMTLKTIRNGVHKIDMYLNAALDLLGGEDGLCQYKCSDGERGWRRDPCPGQGGRGPAPLPGKHRRRVLTGVHTYKYVYEPRRASSCTCMCV